MSEPSRESAIPPRTSTQASDSWAIALTTAGSDAEADAIAAALIEAGLAACVTILPGKSVYRWQGAVQKEAEWQLLIKIRQSQFDAVSEVVRSHHSYDLPELLLLPIVAGSEAYLHWLDTQVLQ